MIKIYNDKSVYVGDSRKGKRCGKGTLYILTDIFSGRKITGTWNDDKLDGFSTTQTFDYVEQGTWTDGKKDGVFIRENVDGTRRAYYYKNDKLLSEENCLESLNIKRGQLGCVQLSDGDYFVGELEKGKPFGYGIIFKNEGDYLKPKAFCERYKGRVELLMVLNPSQLFQDEREIESAKNSGMNGCYPFVVSKEGSEEMSKQTISKEFLEEAKRVYKHLTRNTNVKKEQDEQEENVNEL